MRSAPLVAAAFTLAGVWLSGCPKPTLPDPPRQCFADGTGCLPDEVCVDSACQPRGRCESDADCPSPAHQCVRPALFCELRPGFGGECSAETPCAPGSYCSLGRCRVIAEARPCSRRTDCPQGQACDRLSFFCIEEAPCTLTDSFPEVSCDPEEQCDAITESCRLQCQNECTVATEADDCGAGLRCDGACRCVQCLTNDDCGPGLECNIRAGRCQSENLCFADDDCEPPLICDPRTALCQVAPPACDDDFDCAIAEICNRTTGRCELPGGACIDDRFEDADTPNSAEEIVLDAGAQRLLDDLQLCPDDDDVYGIPLAQGETLTATVTDSDPIARATVWLLDSSGQTSLAFAETAPRGSGIIVYTAPVDETVFLRVNALLAATRYNLDLQKGIGGLCEADALEGAGGNDTIATATPADQAPQGVDLVGTVCPGDVDLFTVNVAAGNALQATLAFDGTRGDLDVAYIDMTTGMIIKQAASLQQPEILARRFLVDTTLLVRVKGFANSTGAYTLRIESLPPFLCNDGLEPDDDAPRDIPLVNGVPPVSEDRGLCQEDDDVWRVVLEDFERLVVAARTTDPDLDIILEVVDGSGAVLRRSPTGRFGTAVTYDSPINQTVLVRARGNFGGMGPYSVELMKENQSSCAPDVSEPNDTPGERAALPAAGALRSICQSDADYFAVEGAAGKRLVVDLSFLHADGDLDVMVLGLDGSQILAVADGQADGEHLELILPLDGVYTLRVFSLTSNAKARYTLTTALEDP